MFDLRTHIRAAKTGKVVQTQPYTLRIVNGERIFYRNGQRFHEGSNEPIPDPVPQAAAPQMASAPAVAVPAVHVEEKVEEKKAAKPVQSKHTTS